MKLRRSTFKGVLCVGSIALGITGLKLTWDALKLHHVHALQRDEYKQFMQNYQLKNVQIMFRHGARTPIKLTPVIEEANYDKESLTPEYENVPYLQNFVITGLEGGERPPAVVEGNYKKHILKGGSFTGQLTLLGMEQMADLGKRIKQDYVNDWKLISKKFDPNEVYVRSSNINRTIQSLTCLLTGLFKDIEGDPIQIPVATIEEETFYPNHHFCIALRRTHRRGWLHVDDIAGHKEIRLLVQKIIGYSEGGPDHHKPIKMNEIRDDLIARKAHGLPIPEKLEAILPQIDLYATLAAKQALCGIEKDRDVGLTLGAGAIIKVVEDKMDLSVSNQKVAKLNLYSVHDSSLVPVLVALGIYDDKWPPYAADLRFELFEHKTTGEHFVRTLYCDQSLERGTGGETLETQMSKCLKCKLSEFVAKEMVLRGCESTLIPVKKFKEVIAPYSVDLSEFWKRCDAVDYAEHEPPKGIKAWFQSFRGKSEPEPKEQKGALVPEGM